MAIARFDKTQQVLAVNSKMIIDYLQSVASLYTNHIGEAFEADTMKGRVFFELHQLDLPAAVEEVFTNSLLLTNFGDKFNRWNPVTNSQSIDDVKRIFVDYFFQPIEDSPHWEAFWSKQRIKIIKSQTANAGADAAIRHILFQIASALTYKIQTNWARQHQDFVIANREKLAVLTNIINSVSDKRDVIESQTKKTDKLIHDAVDQFVFALLNHQIKEKHVASTLLKMLHDVRESEHFKSNTDAEKILYTKIIESLLHLKANNINKFHLKKIADLVIGEINDLHLAAFVAENPPPIYLIKTIEGLMFYLSKEKLQKHSQLIERYHHHQANRERLMPALSFMPPRQLKTSPLIPHREKSGYEKR